MLESSFFNDNRSTSFLSIDILSEHDTLYKVKIISRTVGLFGVASFFWVLLSAMVPWKTGKMLLLLLLGLIILFPAFMFWGYYAMSQQFLGSVELLAVAQTNPGEAVSYLRDFLPLSAMVILAAAIIVLILVSVYVSNRVKLAESFNKRIIPVIVVAMSVGCIVDANENVFNPIYTETKMGLERYAQFKEMVKERHNSQSEIAIDILEQPAGVYILVLGESQNKNHMSAYGYSRETTPWLKSMKGQENFYIFDEAHSCHTHTVPVLSYALTSKSQYNQEEITDAVSLLEVAEAAGYQTAWISNQVRYGAWDTPTSVIADVADIQVWVNPNFGETTTTSKYDMELVKAIEDLPKSDKMFIVVHLMGNHGSYGERYPKDYSSWGISDTSELHYWDDTNTIDIYDNSIQYNDAVMKELSRAAMEIPSFKVLLYLADHADDVDNGLAHNSAKYTQTMTDIPMYLLCSQEYANSHRNLLDVLKKHQDTMFTNDLTFELMLSLMNIRYPRYYNVNDDFTSTEYNGAKGRFLTLHGTKQFN